eukprot:m.118662 g.118662  ORF g.118662 m.118662 type:complete len:239 (-) comp21746_c0_seq1:123-839(-)
MRELGRLALLTLVSNAVAQLSCRFGGSSDSSDEQNQIPSTCASYDTYTAAIGTSIPPASIVGDPCGVDSRCVTAKYEVTKDGQFFDRVALGCVPLYQTDATIARTLASPDTPNHEKFITVNSCPTNDCNMCQAAVTQPAFWWHVYGTALVGAGVTIFFLIACCITGCVWIRRQRENRRNHLLDGHNENTPLLNPYPSYQNPTQVPPRYQDVPVGPPAPPYSRPPTEGPQYPPKSHAKQ